MSTVNVGRKGSGGWRDGILGNPYLPSQAERKNRALHLSQDGCVTKYRRWLWQHIQAEDAVYDALLELAVECQVHPTTLHCPGCPPGDDHCHARQIENAVRWLISQGRAR